MKDLNELAQQWKQEAIALLEQAEKETLPSQRSILEAKAMIFGLCAQELREQVSV